MAKFTEKDNVLEVSFDLALNKQAREEVDVYDIVLKHESGSEENTLVDYELSLKESGATLAVKIPKYYFARLGVYSVAVKLSQRDADALSGRSRIEASQPLCTVISLHRDMESGKTDVELVPFGTTASAGDAEGAAGTPVAFDPATLTEEQVVSLRERVFDMFSSGEEFTSRNVQAYAKLIEVPSGASTYQNSARNFVENALYLGAEDFADIMFASTFLPIGEGTEFDKQQAVEDLAQKHSVILGKMGGNRYNLSSILYLALASLIKSDEQIKELNAKVVNLERTP